MAQGRFAYEGLDRVIHERARLGLLTTLITASAPVAFNDLKQLCALTDGNLSRHLKVLEDEHLVATEKDTEHNRPLTLCRITPLGRTRYLEYLATLEQVLKDAATIAADSSEDDSKADPFRGLRPATL
jgi:DNA-binding transcriptional ArsR family regulator